VPDAPSISEPRQFARPERVIGLAAIVLTALVLAIVLGAAGLSRARADVVAEINRTREARLALHGLLQASVDAQTGQRGYLLTNDPTFLERYVTGRAETASSLERLRQATPQRPESQVAVSRLAELTQTALEQLESPLGPNRLVPAELRQALTDSKASMDRLRAEIGVGLNEVEQHLDEARLEERRMIDRLYWLGAILGVVSVLAIALTFWALRSERRTWRATFGALADARAAAEQARESAVAADLAKTRFLSVASHDMRQPLHALSLYISALERRIENEEARGILAKMERATDSMIAMFATLLDLARVQAGAVQPDWADFALQDVFDRIAAENPGGAVEAAPTPIVLHSDPVLIERALRNLVSNALKHGGGRVRMSATEDGSRAKIVVADDGPGISPDDQERIFDEFVRLDRRGGEGLGLGLAIVKGVAAALDMPIAVESVEGRGARFILRPLLAQSRIAAPPALQSAPALNGVSALIVDDEHLAREAVAGALGDLGADVRTAANEQAVQRVLAEGFTPKLIVMDLRIDGQLRGVEVAKRLTGRITPPPRVIVVTGDTAPETLNMLRESGFAWLIKPVNPRELSDLAAAQVAAR
jgi:C4-dicarboxylate-specific signal transduction histidine kinase